MTVAQWSTVAADNVLSSGTVGTGGVDIDEGCAPSGINNALRDILAQIATFRTAGTFTSIVPTANDSGALGSTTLGWSDLHLATGALINVANGNAVITHSSGIFTVSTGDLRVTTAGTNAASVVTVGGTQTLTNKTLSGTTALASGAVLNFDAGDVTITHSANLLTFAGGSYTFNTGILTASTIANATSIDLSSGHQFIWNSGDVTLTHSANTLTFVGASSGYVFDSTIAATALTASGSSVLIGEARFAQNTTSTPGTGNNTTGAAISTGGVLYASAAAPHQFNRTTDATVVFFASGGTQQGSISIAGATTSYNPFFGSHWSQLADKSQPEIWRGTICETIDELSDFAERVGDRLPKFKISDAPGSDAVYGVFHTWDSEVESRAEIGALGAYFVRIAKGKKVKKGTLIESNGDGCGRPQKSRQFLASTVAKVTASVVVTNYPDGSYLVPCTLHCG